MLKSLKPLILLLALNFGSTSLLQAAKVSQSNVVGKGRFGGYVAYPEHLRVELKIKKDFSPQEMDKTVGWYRIVKQNDSKYHQALNLIKSAFKERGDYQGKKLLSLLKEGVRYSYVIKDGVFRLAEILSDGHPATRFSKHILLADFATQVTYAGELWKDPRNPKKIILDNNSGTFKPRSKDLGKIANLLKKNLKIKIKTEIHRAYENRR